MPEFFNVLPPAAARDLLFQHLPAAVPTETIPTEQALGRVTAAAVHAPHPLPSVRRRTMDGYAVRAADTFGATSTLPAFLTVVGEVKMGRPAGVILRPGQAAVVHTGGMIPDTADAVVPVEQTQVVEETEIEVYAAVAVGQNVLQIGEDVRQGEIVLLAGRRLRPQELGGLLALGITQLEVARRPRVALLATGDEVIHPSQPASPGQIRDINSYTTAGQTERAGGIPVLGGIIGDDFSTLKEAAAKALAKNDMLVMSAGSSVSVRDMTARVIDELGRPGVLAHGIAVKPGKPTIVAVVEGKPVFGLPGNPVSAMILYELLGVPTIYRLQGLSASPWLGRAQARLARNVASETGREDYIPARLEETADELLAHPVFGKSNLIYTLVNADGLIRVPFNKGGLAAGEWVEVCLF
ncbi:MAG: gephyrin-like molybdotransferase Glp [Chloroflexota bacterium]